MKPALDREEARKKADRERQRKIFIGGLPKNLADEKLEEYFSQFGPIQKSYVVKDPYSGKTRGFGFVIFETNEGFEKVKNHPNHTIDGQEVHLKVAQAKDDEVIQATDTEAGSKQDSNQKETYAKFNRTQNYNDYKAAFLNENQIPPINSFPERSLKTPMNYPHHLQKERYEVEMQDYIDNEYHESQFYQYPPSSMHPHYDSYFSIPPPNHRMQYYSLMDVNVSKARSRQMYPGVPHTGNTPRAHNNPNMYPIYRTPQYDNGYEQAYMSSQFLRKEPHFPMTGSQRDFGRAPIKQTPSFNQMRLVPPPLPPNQVYPQMYPHPQHQHSQNNESYYDEERDYYHGQYSDVQIPNQPSYQYPSARPGQFTQRHQPMSDQAINFKKNKPMPASNFYNKAQRVYNGITPNNAAVPDFTNPASYEKRKSQVYQNQIKSTKQNKANNKPRKANEIQPVWTGEEEVEEDGNLKKVTEF